MDFAANPALPFVPPLSPHRQWSRVTFATFNEVRRAPANLFFFSPPKAQKRTTTSQWVSSEAAASQECRAKEQWALRAWAAGLFGG